jgi:hypothetical protein
MSGKQVSIHKLHCQQVEPNCASCNFQCVRLGWNAAADTQDGMLPPTCWQEWVLLHLRGTHRAGHVVCTHKIQVYMPAACPVNVTSRFTPWRCNQWIHNYSASARYVRMTVTPVSGAPWAPLTVHRKSDRQGMITESRLSTVGAGVAHNNNIVTTNLLATGTVWHQAS